MLMTRPGTHDDAVVSEIAKGDYAWMDVTAEDVVLDIGAHIGAFTVDAALKGARVVACEPEPDNVRLLRENIARLGVSSLVTVVPCAVVEVASGSVRFYGGGEKTGSGTLYPMHPRVDSVQVETVGICELLEATQPTKVKMDCEGAEYALIDAIAACPSVRAVILEAHVAMVPHGVEKFPVLVETLRSSFQSLWGVTKTRKRHVRLGASR